MILSTILDKKVAKTSLLLQTIILRHVCPNDAPFPQYQCSAKLSGLEYTHQQH
jgi:hypothetical protein